MSQSQIQALREHVLKWTDVIVLAMFVLVMVFTYRSFTNEAEAVGSLYNVQAFMNNTLPSGNGNFDFLFHVTSSLPAYNCNAMGKCFEFQFTFPVSNTSPLFTISTSLAYADIAVTTTPSIYGLAYAGFTTGKVSSTASAADTVNVFVSSTAANPITTGTQVEVRFSSERFTNPAKYASSGYADSYALSMNTYASGTGFATTTAAVDTGSTHIAINDAVTLSATVNAALTFQVSSVPASTNVGDGYTTDVGSTTTTCPFGTLTPNTPKMCAQRIYYATNAPSGAIVYVMQDGNMRQTGDAAMDIDQFKDGVRTTPASSTAWTSPGGSVSDERTWGHLGYRSNDGTVFTATTTFAGIMTFPGSTAAPLEITASSGTNAELAKATAATSSATFFAQYRVEVSSLQEAGSYTNTIMYEIVPKY